MSVKVSIIIPAYNEEKRIENTLEEYCRFFEGLKREGKLDFEIFVVLNACKDNTLGVVKECQKKFKEIRFLNFEGGGKGFAITKGFEDALRRDNHLIGFVDADMATSPEAFSELVRKCKCYDGIIGSRYVPGAIVNPKQPLKRIIVSRLGNILIRSLFFMKYKDTQCGAKLFKRSCVETILPKIGETEWGFDIELLYLAKREGFKIKELATVWEDKIFSTLNLKRASLQVLLAVIQLRFVNSYFGRILNLFKYTRTITRKIIE